ncbi:uncharacterized protein LOC128217140 [Mya arenaria]|uniref:uncharacterized protein LOC128217140 n=1 Tax=Mya arenaria TaxID=6604 RepID=UPI0022E8A43A|nr:uncharacterized protein LOC128217140 [Mya arenaria]
MGLALYSVYVCFILAVESAVAKDKDPCDGSTMGIMPHPGECQLFYNCSRTDSPFLLGNHVQECTYPDLFDATLLTCRDFRGVDCGPRVELVSGCEYKSNKCNGSHCKACYIRFPNCKGLPDGKIPINWQMFTQFYAECEKGRFIGKLECPQGLKGVPMVFDPFQGVCDKLENVIASSA